MKEEDNKIMDFISHSRPDWIHSEHFNKDYGEIIIIHHTTSGYSYVHKEPIPNGNLPPIYRLDKMLDFFSFIMNARERAREAIEEKVSKEIKEL